MCKSELRFQQGERGCYTNPKYSRRRVDPELESHLFLAVFFFFLIFINKVSNADLSVLRLAVVCPTY